jgi:hypothetical protein
MKNDEHTTPYEPTQQAYHNPYDIYPYTDLPPVPPPPPKKRRHIVAIATVVTVIAILLAWPVYALVTRSISTKSTPIAHVTSVPTATATKYPTPTPYPKDTPTIIPTTSVTADELYNAFLSSYISVTNPTAMDHSFWLHCCSFYPAHGSVHLNETVDYNTLIIAVFNNEQDARLIASQQQWAAQYIQVDMCLLLSLEGPVDISYYRPVMEQYCI